MKIIAARLLTKNQTCPLIVLRVTFAPHYLTETSIEWPTVLVLIIDVAGFAPSF